MNNLHLMPSFNVSRHLPDMTDNLNIIFPNQNGDPFSDDLHANYAPKYAVHVVGQNTAGLDDGINDGAVQWFHRSGPSCQ